ncbi:MAG: hypothetical protein GY866_28320 [Proteobacteria bacterium]|nr:hypothetical protein [Pseudomonadota bacterium]
MSRPPPSSGGIALVQLLTATDDLDMKGMGYNDDRTVHFMTELQRRVYADRAAYLGDSDFFKVPAAALLSEDYLEGRMSDIDPDDKTDSKNVSEGKPQIAESMETTHYTGERRSGQHGLDSAVAQGTYAPAVSAV